MSEEEQGQGQQQGQQPRERRVGVVYYDDRKADVEKKCMQAHLEMLQCLRGNHLLSGRSCQEQQTRYWDCMAQHGEVKSQGSFLEAAAQFAQQCGAQLEDKRQVFADVLREWGGGKR